MMKKMLFILVLLVVIAVAAVYFFGSAALNKGIKHGVESVGSQVTQTPVTLSDVSISLLSGSGNLSGLNVSNPAGYKSENIFALGHIDIEVDTGSIFTNKIIINKIHIKRPEIRYEKKLSGSNLKTLLDNIDQFTGLKSDAPKDVSPDETGAPKQIVIKQLIIENGLIYVGLLGVMQEIPLPRLEMNNLGEDREQASIEKVLNTVLSQVLSSIGSVITGAGQLLKGAGDEALKAIQDTGLHSVEDAASDALDIASEGLKSLLGN